MQKSVASVLRKEDRIHYTYTTHNMILVFFANDNVGKLIITHETAVTLN